MRNLFTLLAIAPALSAQTTFTSPPGIGADGASSVLGTQVFGTAASGRRFQHIVNDAAGVPGTGGIQIGSIKMRPDAAATASLARTADITLVMDNVNYGAITTTFANNYSGSQTTFALGNVSLPATTGGAGFVITLPVSPSFVYFGNNNTTNPSNTALMVEIQTTNVVLSGGTSSNYSLDCVDGTATPTVGVSTYNGLQGCIVPPNTSRFDIFKVGPTSTGGTTSCRQYGLRGPASSFGVMALGLTDTNSNFGGLLCVPFRSAFDLQIPITTTATGGVASSATPIDISFPDLGPGQTATFYTQFVVFDAARQAPELQVALSDGIKWDITAPSIRERRIIYSTSNAAAATGSSTNLFVPVMQFN